MSDQLIEYHPRTDFPGTIGTTIDDSNEAWPVPKGAPTTPVPPSRGHRATRQERALSRCFTGTTEQVTFDLSGEAIDDTEADTRHGLSKQ